MVRLAQYLADLSDLMGEQKLVHFLRLEKGSLAVVHFVDDEAVPKVEQRVNETKRGEGPREALDAVKNINRRLREDKASGVLQENSGTEIIRFPGYKEPELSFGTFPQQGSIDGQVIVIGGKGDPVPVHLQSEDTVHLCDVGRSLARELARYLFGDQVRAHGTGRWYRDEQGTWHLERFRVTSFEVLNEQSLSSAVTSLRAIPGNKWGDTSDPWAELERIRHGPSQRK